VKTFNVVAMDRPLVYNTKAKAAIEVDFERKIEVANPEAKIFALEEEAARVATGAQPMPLTLRVNLGDCIKVNLKQPWSRPPALPPQGIQTARLRLHGMWRARRALDSGLPGVRDGDARRGAR
jgi:hypothetical protein